ncbi:hypothetical protein MettiDRAFT_0752 [Methanolobus tindarius DSM 2278]|uniref:C2H2-type domain-containing protein n=1 Tax=Methanolobus tindarius DSM 2278 TaxID=1090322 RepID=W9DUH2_METTI|nr:hypothetical protein [Methanolobus tindarius]ETA67332.1 hypothetical protein MettiDRAFT_0752 [Methanolobus tindarius DSM 2278]
MTWKCKFCNEEFTRYGDIVRHLRTCRHRPVEIKDRYEEVDLDPETCGSCKYDALQADEFPCRMNRSGGNRNEQIETRCPCGKEVQMVDVDKKITWYCPECASEVKYDPDTGKISKVERMGIVKQWLIMLVIVFAAFVISIILCN